MSFWPWFIFSLFKTSLSFNILVWIMCKSNKLYYIAIKTLPSLFLLSLKSNPHHHPHCHRHLFTKALFFVMFFWRKTYFLLLTNQRSELPCASLSHWSILIRGWYYRRLKLVPLSHSFLHVKTSKCLSLNEQELFHWIFFSLFGKKIFNRIYFDSWSAKSWGNGAAYQKLLKTAHRAVGKSP